MQYHHGVETYKHLIRANAAVHRLNSNLSSTYMILANIFSHSNYKYSKTVDRRHTNMRMFVP